MRAMVATAFGPPDVLQMQDLPEPVPRDFDLLVEVHAAGVNPVDCKIRATGLGMPRKFPLVLGFDVSGVVRAVGRRVERFRPGDEIFASPSIVRDGANAELVCVDSRTAALKPASLDHVQAAAMPLVTITAWEALHKRTGMHRGETVLITGGAGGVGHIAIQLAKLQGCRVIATAGREESIAFCRGLGADVVINYQEEDVAERVSHETAGAGCPVVFDTVGGDTLSQSLACVGVNGRAVVILPPPAEAPVASLYIKNATLHMEFMPATTMYGVHLEGQAELLRTVAELADAGRLKPHVSMTAPLEELAAAHRQQETKHTTGKIVVKVR